MNKAFPLTREGRQTLIYLTFAFAGPALTGIVIWAMVAALEHTALWPTFRDLALIVAAALMIVVMGLACFVSIRAIKIGKDGIEATGDGDGE